VVVLFLSHPFPPVSPFLSLSHNSETPRSASATPRGKQRIDSMKHAGSLLYNEEPTMSTSLPSGNGNNNDTHKVDDILAKQSDLEKEYERILQAYGNAWDQNTPAEVGAIFLFVASLSTCRLHSTLTRVSSSCPLTLAHCQLVYCTILLSLAPNITLGGRNITQISNRNARNMSAAGWFCVRPRSRHFSARDRCRVSIIHAPRLRRQNEGRGPG
jgi:hypothetical protein